MSKKYFKTKRVLAMFLTLCMLIGLMPTTVYASGTDNQADCITCGGLGIVTEECDDCGGLGMVICSMCGGSATIMCGGCNGEGGYGYDYPIDDEGHFEYIFDDCSTCGGSGYENCYGCSGSGEVTCQSCDGRGTTGGTDCQTCNGTGKIDAQWIMDAELFQKNVVKGGKVDLLNNIGAYQCFGDIDLDYKGFDIVDISSSNEDIVRVEKEDIYWYAYGLNYGEATLTITGVTYDGSNYTAEIMHTITVSEYGYALDVETPDAILSTSTENIVKAQLEVYHYNEEIGEVEYPSADDIDGLTYEWSILSKEAHGEISINGIGNGETAEVQVENYPGTFAIKLTVKRDDQIVAEVERNMNAYDVIYTIGLNFDPDNITPGTEMTYAPELRAYYADGGAETIENAWFRTVADVDFADIDFCDEGGCDVLNENNEFVHNYGDVILFYRNGVSDCGFTIYAYTADDEEACSRQVYVRGDSEYPGESDVQDPVESDGTFDSIFGAETFAGFVAAQNDSYYSWNQSRRPGYALESTNHFNDSESCIKITALADCILSFDYSVSSEPNCDNLLICINNNEILKESGFVQDSIAIDLKEEDILEIVYSKDVSASDGDDCARLGNFSVREACEHQFMNGICTNCGVHCRHEFEYDFEEYFGLGLEEYICLICGKDCAPRWVPESDMTEEKEVLRGCSWSEYGVEMFLKSERKILDYRYVQDINIVSSDPDIASVEEVGDDYSVYYVLNFNRPGAVTLTYTVNVDGSELTFERPIIVINEEYTYRLNCPSSIIPEGTENTFSVDCVWTYYDENDAYHEKIVSFPEDAEVKWRLLTNNEEYEVNEFLSYEINGNSVTVCPIIRAKDEEFFIWANVFDKYGDEIFEDFLPVYIDTEIQKFVSTELENAKLEVGDELAFSVDCFIVDWEKTVEYNEGEVLVEMYSSGNAELYYNGTFIYESEGAKVDLSNPQKRSSLVLKAIGEGYVAIDIHRYSENGHNYFKTYVFDIEKHVHSDLNTDNECDRCGELKYTVSLESSLTGGESSIATLAGGGKYWAGESVTVTAQTKPGCKFMGWYDGDTRVCENLRYSFTMGAVSTNLVAMYEPNASVQVKITAEGGNFTIGDSGDLQTSYIQNVPIGTQLVLNAEDPENVNAWVNSSDKVISTQGSITITVTSETDITLRYKVSAPGQAMVEFLSDYGQIMDCHTYTVEDTVEFPAGPTKTGWDFTGWDMTAEEIIAAIENNEKHITVRPLYTQKDIEYTVTVVYPDGVDEDEQKVLEGGTITVYAKNIDGSTFSCWKDTNDNVLGYSSSYFTRVMDNITIVAVYDAIVEPEPVVVMSDPRAFADGEKNKVSFTVNYDVPNGYSVDEVGIIRSTTASDEETLIIGGENVKRHISSLQCNKGCYTYNINVGSSVDTMIFARGYVIVTNNATGNSEEICTDIVAGSFNSIVQ